MPNRIRELRLAKRPRKWSQRRLAEAVHPETTPQQIGRLEKDDRELTQSWMERIARALDCSPEDLLPGTNSKKPRVVALVGYLGVGELYYPDPDSGPWTGFDLVEAPQGSGGDGFQAVRIRGNVFAPAYFAGDLLYFKRDDTPISDLIGKHCVVQIKGGPACMRCIEPSSRKGRYRLVSVLARAGIGEPSIDDVEIEWAAHVKYVTRA